MTNVTSEILVSFIIINYKTPDIVKENINSIEKNIKSVIFEIIVVDNASNDNSVENIKNNCSDINVVSLENNIGYGGAVNAGAAVAKGHFLIILNSDIILVEDKIAELIDFYRNNKAGIIGLQLRRPKLQIQNTYSRFPSEWTPLLVNISMLRHIKSLHTRRYILHDRFGYKTMEAEWVTGAFMLIEKIYFDQLNGFDEKFFMFYEDVDICRRSLLGGRRNFYYAESYAIHAHQASVNQIKSGGFNQAKIWEKESALYYIKKYFPEQLFLIKNMFIILYFYRLLIHYFKYLFHFFGKKRKKYEGILKTDKKILHALRVFQ